MASSREQRQAHDIHIAAAYYDGYAARYDADVDGQAANTRLRAAFQQRVAAVAGAGGTILDFGCGTGADASWYAAHGHRVIAYDVSPEMLAVLRTRCAREVAAGAVVPVVGELGALLAVLRREGRVAAIAANFAALSHVGDLAPLFAALVPHLAPGGAVVASMLNPIAASDMRMRWWWRGVFRSPRSGAIRLDGLVTTYRHFARSVRRAAWPGLRLERWESTADLADVGTRLPLHRRLASTFVFVTLRRS